MRLLWLVVAVLVVLWFLGVGVSALQVAMVALLVHALGGTGVVPSL